jgi:hypothetical protein
MAPRSRGRSAKPRASRVRDSQAVEKASSGTINRPTFTIREYMMKKLFALPLAVVFVAACSESTTAPTATSANLTPSYAKPTTVDTSAICTTNCLVNDTYTFESAITATGSGTTPSVLSTDTKPNTIGTQDAPSVVTAPNGQGFVGRFENVNTELTLGVGTFSTYQLSFDLYTIGSWDGKGKQAQNGAFLANVFSIQYSCSNSTTRGTVFASTFSNQETVQQDFPNDISVGGGFKAATGSYATDLLGYKNTPTISNTPVFRSFGDVEYRLYYTGSNPCGTGAATFVLTTSNPSQQSAYDESWGIDNIVVRTK